MPKYEFRVERYSFGTIEVEASDPGKACEVALASAVKGDVLMVNQRHDATLKRQIGEPWVQLELEQKPRNLGIRLTFRTAPGTYFDTSDEQGLEQRLTSLGFIELQVGAGGSGYNLLTYWAKRGPGKETGVLSPEEIAVLVAPRQNWSAKEGPRDQPGTPPLPAPTTT